MKQTTGKEDDGHVDFEIPVYHSGLELRDSFLAGEAGLGVWGICSDGSCGSGNGIMEETIDWEDRKTLLFHPYVF